MGGYTINNYVTKKMELLIVDFWYKFVLTEARIKESITSGWKISESTKRSSYLSSYLVSILGFILVFILISIILLQEEEVPKSFDQRRLRNIKLFWFEIHHILHPRFLISILVHILFSILSFILVSILEEV